MHIAAVLQSKRITPADHAFMVAACDLQMRRDFAPAWGEALPEGPEPWPVSAFSRLDGLTPAEYKPCFGMDNIGQPTALGFHDDVLGYQYIRWLVDDPRDGTTMSHEVCELRLDPTCDLWRLAPDGMEDAQEASDAVEGDEYGIDVTIAGQTRTIRVSNFVTPAWFEKDAQGPFDFMGRLSAPFSMTAGGYRIRRNPRSGKVTNIFADDLEHLAAQTESARPQHMAMAKVRRAHVLGKLADPVSRTARRMASTPF